MFTTGSVHDSRMAQEVTRDIVGRVFADAGYQLRKEDLAALAVGGVFMHNATRKNMKRLISKEQFDAIEKRNIIETVWSPQGEFLPCVYQGPKRHGHVPAFLLQHCSFFVFALTLRF